MKTIVNLLLILISSVVVAQEYKVVQINAEWNNKNKINLPYSIEGATYKYALLEDQSEKFQKKILAVPVVVLLKDNKVVRQWSADLSFKLILTVEEIAYAIREDKQKIYRRKTN